MVRLVFEAGEELMPYLGMGGTVERLVRRKVRSGKKILLICLCDVSGIGIIVGVGVAIVVLDILVVGGIGDVV